MLVLIQVPHHVEGAGDAAIHAGHGEHRVYAEPAAPAADPQFHEPARSERPIPTARRHGQRGHDEQHAGVLLADHGCAAQCARCTATSTTTVLQTGEACRTASTTEG